LKTRKDSQKRITFHKTISKHKSYSLIQVSSRMHGGECYIKDTYGNLILAPPENHADDKASSIFADALISIKKAVLVSLGRQYPIGVITYPQYFNRTSLHALRDVVMSLEPSLFRSWQSRRNIHCNGLAYSMDTCEGFGMNSTNCDINEDFHRVIFVDYNIGILDLTAATIGEFGSYPWAHNRTFSWDKGDGTMDRLSNEDCNVACVSLL
jgi:hypothetical protein